ncbi:unnamed protein product [Leptosia nina]|uniref:Uncharacterized protein n=1 Tax=Leptosia nina TaxID=320188 RepID=A0AAV1JXN6_9NEOP
MLEQLLCLFSITRSILTITVEIDGRIDLGPNWNYEYRVANAYKEIPYHPFLRTQRTENPQVIHKFVANFNNTDILEINRKDNETNNVHNTNKTVKSDETRKEKSKSTKESLDHDKIDLNALTTRKAKKKVKNIENSEAKARKVKEDAKIRDFILHINKQTLKVFDDIKKKTGDRKLKRQIATLKRSFEDKFSNYLKQTYNHTLKTNLGRQKIIINTIDTSNKLLHRLINNLYQDVDKGLLRSDVNAVNAFQKEIDREKDLENIHACKKLGVCRLNGEFSDFLVEILLLVLQTDDGKVKQAADALTEVLKTEDFDNILNYDLQVQLKRQINLVENFDAFMTRAMFLTLKNLIKNKNRPIVVMNSLDSYLANKTVAFQDILNMLDEKLQKADNEKVWNEIKEDVIKWNEGRYNNALAIVQTLIKHIKTKFLDKMDLDAKKRLNKSMEILLSHIK